VDLPWPDCALVIVPGAVPRLLVHRDLSFWERVPEPDWEHFGDHFHVIELADVEEALKREIAAAARGRVAFVAEDRRRAAAWGFGDGDVNPAGLVGALDRLRTLKTLYEVACLAEANRRAARGHRAVAAAFQNEEAPSELHLHLLYLSATLQDDVETPYKNIVALGGNAAILHHVHYGREAPRVGRSLLLDAGAVCRGYASDVTRTYADEGSPGGRAFADLIARTERMQQALCARVRVGTPYEDLHDEAHGMVAKILREMGISSLSEDELVARNVTRKFFPHGLGHSLGLQTHDVGCLAKAPRPENPWLRNTSVIAPAQVFTIEPGIYFIDALLGELGASPQGPSIDWKLVDALRPFGGIRIEDDLVVLEPSGRGPVVRNLTREALGAK
jgi:Xaa-Pro dipeptidase